MNPKTLLACVLLLLPPLTRGAGDAPLDRSTLRGLKGVGIVIDAIDPELQKLGVTEATVTAHLLARLRAAHIGVDPNAAEFIGFRITSVRANRGPFALSLTIGLYQPILISRDQHLHTSTQTWEVESVLMADPKAVEAACAESTDDLADRFVTAFRSVNPQ